MHASWCNNAPMLTCSGCFQGCCIILMRCNAMSAYCHPVASCGDFMACTAAMSCRLRGLVPKRHYNVHLVEPNRAPPQPFRHRVDLRGLSQHQRDKNSFKLEQQSAQSLRSSDLPSPRSSRFSLTDLHHFSPPVFSKSVPKFMIF